jgi:Lecithin retinol acyltransferase
VVIVSRLVNDPIQWAGAFVGVKLLTFGGTLTWIAWKSLKSDAALVYELEMPEPETGELYAVYFGTAFHLGVYIGQGEIVHYLNDNFVYRVTWEKFLEGRTPEHWTYPDLEPVATDAVVRTALSEVGKTYPYNLLKFNCENFAIFCKSGGATYYSKYAQIAGGASGVATHPILGMVAELNTRFVEWLAFHLGGPAGKQLSLSIRRMGAAVTRWLVSGSSPAER